MERPLAAPTISLILGLSLAATYAWFFPAYLLLPLLVLTLLTFFARDGLPFVLALSLVLLVVANISMRPFVEPHLPANHISNFSSAEQFIIEGVIDSRPQATERGGRLYLQVERIFRDRQVAPASGRVVLYIRDGMTTLLCGDRVRFSSRIQRPRNYGLPGEFDYAGYLALKNIHASVFVREPGELILIRSAVQFPLQRRIDQLAGSIGNFIDASVPATEASILRALLIGDAGQVPRAIKDAYSRSGVNHILSISGFHIGVIALFIFQILMAAARSSETLLLRFNLRRIILLLTLPLIIFYLFLSGAAPATVRSVIMLGLLILALVLEREADPVNALILAALCILAISPTDLFEISFQLSFLALWGILVLTPIFMTPFSHVPEGIPRKLLLFFMASAAATVATIFPVAFYFQRISATGLISNFFIVPLLGYGAVVLGFSAILLVAAAPFAAALLLKLAAHLVSISNQIIVILARIPTFTFFQPGRFELLLFYLALTVMTFVARGWRRTACFSALTVLCAGSLLLPPQQQEVGTLKINFFSVGQGEATLVTFPDGKRMLVDGGGNVREGGSDVGERLLAPALWKLGVDRLDLLVLSHPHPDHLQGLKYVAANFPVGEFWYGADAGDSADFVELLRILAQRRVPVRSINNSSAPQELGGARLEPLAPFVDSAMAAGREDGDVNEASLVFRLTYGEFTMLFTGDIGAATEERLTVRPDRLKCVILKVPHHGSRYSSSAKFIAAAAPGSALISAGYCNSFHLPAGETLDRLRQCQVEVYRTDLDGSIQVLVDNGGRNVVFNTSFGHL